VTGDTSQVNVRSGPDYSYQKLLILPKGAEVPVLGVNSDSSWYKVDVEGTTGWIVSQLVTAVGNCAAIPRVAILPNPSVQATVTMTLPAPGDTRNDSKGSAQVWVSAGCFQMGSDPAKDNSARDDEQPFHQVCITKGFWLDKYEVSNADYQKFIDDGGYTNHK